MGKSLKNYERRERLTGLQLARRRQVVAEYYIQGYRQVEIVELLASYHPDMIASQSTVSRDIIIIEREWADKAAKTIETHRARQLAEITELKNIAREKGALTQLRKLIELEARLLGTYAPRQVDLAVEVDHIDLVWKGALVHESG